jgi:hypothetical protein
MGMLTALALAAFTGFNSEAADSKAKTGCACCGAGCVCPDCTCDVNTKAGWACDCCGGAACCTATSARGVKAEPSCCSKKTADARNR